MPELATDMKTCTKCGKEKSLNDFYCRKDRYYTGVCKSCIREKQKIYPKSKIKYPREYYRELEMLKKYNLSFQEYKTLYAEQNGKCAICRKAERELKASLHIDHCHESGKVRGLLCSSCNQGLGYFKDNIELLQDAMNYLILHK